MYQVIDGGMAGHPTEAKSAGESVGASSSDQCATCAGMRLAYVCSEPHADRHSNRLIVESKATGRDRQRVQPVAGVLGRNFIMFIIFLFFFIYRNVLILTA